MSACGRGKDAGAGRQTGTDHPARENDCPPGPIPGARHLKQPPTSVGEEPFPATTGRRDDFELRRIAVRRIAEHEFRPRRASNPAYGRLKVAIRRDGLAQPLSVTRRPGCASYLLWGGGATRLSILKELAAEAGGARFAVAPCLLRPWRGEAELLLSHLKENELRGAVAFVDLAAAVANVKDLLEREADAALDGRRLARRLGAMGFEIDYRTLALATYAVKRLLTALPLAARGLSRSDIEDMRSLDRAALALWRDWSIDAITEYDTVFRALCTRHDGPGWALADLRRALAEEMAVRGKRTAQSVVLELQARLSRSSMGNE